MIEFVNLQDGRIFHVDTKEQSGGECPYTFWFENGQSTNLNYILKICFISDKASIKASIDSEVFSILKLNQQIPIWLKTNNEVINAKEYVDIEKLKTKDYRMYGYPVDTNGFTGYMYMLYILGSSKDAGEIRDEIVIDDNTYEVGADFYNPNEILKSNLENFDVTIPESIQKAIYDIDVHEESNDNVTLNRKYKELLMNYWSIVANKGSYNSLQNSLAWFEWGDLTRIEEIWTRHNEQMTDYFQEALNRPLTDEFIAQFNTHAKTTYIGLYTALSHITQDANGNMEYCDTRDITQTLEHENAMAQVGLVGGPTPERKIKGEPNPHLKLVVSKWNVIDMALKMTLLGNFYSTYFMPIHLDLIHSTVEHWVFTYALKVLQTSGASYGYERTFGKPFEMAWKDNVKIHQHTGRTYSFTMFKGVGDVFGYNDSIEPEPDNNFNPLRYFFGGASGVIPFECRIPAVDFNDVLYKQKVTWVRDDGEWGTIPDESDPYCYVNITPSLWFVQDKYNTYEPNHFVRLAPGTYDREYIGAFEQVVTHPDHGCGIPGLHEQFITAFPVTSNFFNEHDWVELDYVKNHLWLVDPSKCWGINQEAIKGDSVRSNLPFALTQDVDGNKDSYPNEPTYQYTYLFNFGFHIGFRKAGHYRLTFEFTTTSGNVWTRTVEVDIIDDVANHIELSKVTPLTLDERLAMTPGDNENWLGVFQMHPSREGVGGLVTETQIVDNKFEDFTVYHPYQEHSIFISSKDNEGKNLLNHTVIFTVPQYNSAILKRNNEEFTVGTNEIESKLNEYLPDYMWIVNKYSGQLRVIGVCRYFENEADQITYRFTGVRPAVEDDAWRALRDYHTFEYGFIDRLDFHPIMYRLEKFDNRIPISTHDIVYVEPVIKYGIDEISNWVFENRSNLQAYESVLKERNHYAEGGNYGDEGGHHPGGLQATMVRPFEEMSMLPGYYNIELHYKQAGQDLVYSCDSAFIMS